MATGTETISLRWQAELGDLRRQMATIPGITEKEAKAMARALDTQMKKAEKAAKKAATAPKQSWENLKKTISTVTVATTAAVAAFAAVATGVAALAKDVIDARNELGDMALRTGLAVDTLQALQQAAEGSGQELDALFKGAQRIPKLMADVEAGLSTAVRGFDNLGVETHKTDGTMREADDVFKDIVGSLGDIESDTERAARAMDLFGRQGGAMVQALAGGAAQMEALVNFTNQWGVSSAPEAIAEAARMQHEMAALGTVWRGAKDKLLDYIVASSGLKNVAGAVVGYSTTAITFVDLLGERLEVLLSTFSAMASADSPLQAARLGLDAYTQATTFAGGAVIDLGSALGTGRDAAQKMIVGWEELMESLATGTGGGGGGGGPLGDAETGVSGLTAALEKMDATFKAAGSDQLSDIDKINEKLREQVNEITNIQAEYAAVPGVFEAGNRAIDAVAERAARDRKEIRDKEALEIAEYWAAVAEMQRETYEQRIELEEAARLAGKAAAADLFGSVSQLAEMTAQKQGAANAEAGERWFKWYQRLAIVQSAINGALAFEKALADYGLPWGLAVGAAAAAAVGVEAAVISSQSMPSYHAGGMAYEAPQLAPDEGLAVVRPGREAFLTERGIDAMGGPEAIPAVNRGEGGGTQIVMPIMYKHRVFGRVMSDSYQIPGSPTRAVIKQGSKVGHRRRS